MQDGGTILLCLWQYRFWPLTDERLVSCEEQSNVNVSTLRRLNCRTQVQYYCVCDKYRFWPLTDARFVSCEEQSNVNVSTLRRLNCRTPVQYYCVCDNINSGHWRTRGSFLLRSRATSTCQRWDAETQNLHTVTVVMLQPCFGRYAPSLAYSDCW